MTNRGVAPTQAREISMRCDLCGKACYGRFPFAPSQTDRLRIMKAAMDEHRQVCTAGTAESRRTYTLLYA